jgi:hypothetical protein
MGALFRMGVNPWLLLQYANITGVSTPDYLRQIRGEDSAEKPKNASTGSA